MIVRVILILAFVVDILNLRVVFGLGALSNLVEKSVFLALSLLVIALRPTSKPILGLLAANIALIVFLGFATTFPDYSWVTTLFGLNQIIIVYALLSFTPERADCRVFLITLALLPIAASLLGVLYQTLGFYNIFREEYTTGVVRFQGSLIPSYMSGFSMCAIPAALMLAIADRRPWFFVVLVLDVLTLLMAGGRATLVVAVLVSAAALLFGRGIVIQRRIWALGAGIAALPIAAAIFGPKLLERFENSGDNGRSVMWNYILALHEKYPGTGIGFSHAMDVIPRSIFIQTGSFAAHSDYLRLQLELGTIGMPIMYVLLTLAVLISASRRGRPDIVMLTAYAGFLLISNTDNALAGPTFFPLFISAAMMMYYFDPTYRDTTETASRGGRYWRMGAIAPRRVLAESAD